MFKSTRYRLVTLYAIVFFILLNCFGAILYFSTQQRLYSQMDNALQKELETYAYFMNRFPKRDFPFRPNHLMYYLYWDSEQKLISQTPKESFGELELDYFSGALEHADNPQTVYIEGSVFRVINIEAGAGYLQIAYNLEPARKVLDYLLYFFGAGSIASVIVAFLAGYFLASRALVPIERAWGQQSQFVSDASHELRTPLSVLKINLERLFRHPDRTIEEESEKISVMIDETKRMSKLVENLLTLARTDSREPQIMKTKLELQPLIEKVVREFQDVAVLKGIRLEVQLHDELSLYGDLDRLHQLLVIVLDNAIKYTKEGRVSVSSKAEGYSIHITISDTGIGIAHDDIPKIFDRFYRADKVRNRVEGGTGLGLSIAKWIVDAHHGTIRAESVPDRGTSIHIVLPIGREGA
jgi:two-component system sensor histidine kinase CiaH